MLVSSVLRLETFKACPLVHLFVIPVVRATFSRFSRSSYLFSTPSGPSLLFSSSPAPHLRTKTIFYFLCKLCVCCWCFSLLCVCSQVFQEILNALSFF